MKTPAQRSTPGNSAPTPPPASPTGAATLKVRDGKRAELDIISGAGSLTLSKVSAQLRAAKCAAEEREILRVI